MLKSKFLSVNDILIIPSSVNAGDVCFLVVNDPKVRLFQLLCCLISWIDHTKIKTIVLGDNSNLDYDFSGVCEYARKKGKRLEVLLWDNNRIAKIKGKGAGEGQLIEFILKSSRYINSKTIFYKITGRIFISNFDEIYERHDSSEAVFDFDKNLCTIFSKKHRKNIFRFMAKRFMAGLRDMPIRQAKGFFYDKIVLPTVFYKSSVTFFKKNLLKSYLRVNDRKGYSLENIYFDCLRKKTWSNFDIKPKYVGVNAGSGLTLGKYSKDVTEKVAMFR